MKGQTKAIGVTEHYPSCNAIKKSLGKTSILNLASKIVADKVKICLANHLAGLEK